MVAVQRLASEVSKASEGDHGNESGFRLERASASATWLPSGDQRAVYSASSRDRENTAD